MKAMSIAPWALVTSFVIAAGGGLKKPAFRELPMLDDVEKITLKTQHRVGEYQKIGVEHRKLVVRKLQDDVTESVVPDRHYVLDLQWATFELELIPGEVICTMQTRTFNGTIPGPVLGMRPGEVVRVTYRNVLKEASPSESLDGAGDDSYIDQHPIDDDYTEDDLEKNRNKYRLPDITNLHTHGPWVSGKAPGDDIQIHIRPGYQYTYQYYFPEEHMPGMSWYHPHFHGSSSLQVGGGAVSPIIIMPRKNEALSEKLRSIRDERADGGDPEIVSILGPTSLKPGPAVATNSPSYGRPVGGDIGNEVIYEGVVEKDLIFSIQTWDFSKWTKVLKATKDKDWTFKCRKVERSKGMSSHVGNSDAKNDGLVASGEESSSVLEKSADPRILTGFPDNIDIPVELQRRFPGMLTQFTLVNGVLEPQMTITKNKWQRWRFLYTSSANPVFNIEIPASACEVQLLAKDNIFINDFPRQLRNGEIPLPSGGRSEVLLRCSKSFVVTGRLPASIVAIVNVVEEDGTPVGFASEAPAEETPPNGVIPADFKKKKTAGDRTVASGRIATVPIERLSPWQSYDSILNPAYLRDLRDGGAYFPDRPDLTQKTIKTEQQLLLNLLSKRTTETEEPHMCIAPYLEQFQKSSKETILAETGVNGVSTADGSLDGTIPTDIHKIRYGQIRLIDDCLPRTNPQDIANEINHTYGAPDSTVANAIDDDKQVTAGINGGSSSRQPGVEPVSSILISEQVSSSSKRAKNLPKVLQDNRKLRKRNKMRGRNLRFRKRKNKFPLRRTTTSRRMSVTPLAKPATAKLDNNCINNQKYQPNVFLQFPKLGEVQERWVLGISKHPFHQHAFPFQILGGFEESDYFRVGDWHDSWFMQDQPKNKFAMVRWRPERFGDQRVIIHCHLLNHQDQGMMAQDWVIGSLKTQNNFDQNGDLEGPLLPEIQDTLVRDGGLRDQHNVRIKFGTSHQRNTALKTASMSSLVSNFIQAPPVEKLDDMCLGKYPHQTLVRGSTQKMSVLAAFLFLLASYFV